jgi:hypothetical protein
MCRAFGPQGNGKSNDNSKGFNAKGAKGAKFRQEEQATATARANAGISPLRRTIEPSCAGRDANFNPTETLLRLVRDDDAVLKRRLL